MEEKRNRAILLLRESGEKYREIGKKFNLSQEAVYQICRHEIRREKLEQEFPGLQIRTINVLRRNGFKTMEEIATEYFNDDYGMSQIKGIGKKMMREIDEAMLKYRDAQKGRA